MRGFHNSAFDPQTLVLLETYLGFLVPGVVGLSVPSSLSGRWEEVKLPHHFTARFGRPTNAVQEHGTMGTKAKPLA